MLKDADIREPLFDFLEEQFGKVRIIEEKIIGLSRADVVMVTEDAISGLEIKSDADSYTRLASQIKDYDRYYDYNYIVVGTTHAHHVAEHVPEYWGIITVEDEEGELDFYILRKPKPNPKVKLELQMSLLWRPELALLQLQNNMPKYKEKNKDFVIKRIIERMSLDDGHKNKIELSDLKRQISSVLFERDYNSISQVLKDYKKSEIQKKIDATDDPAEKMQLMMDKETRKINMKKSFKRRKRRVRRIGNRK